MKTHRTFGRFVFAMIAGGSLFCAPCLYASQEVSQEPILELPAADTIPPAVLSPGDSPASRTATLELLLENAIGRRLISGGVVVVGNHEGILATAARGKLDVSADSPALSEHTIFDLASLTKVIATTPAVMKLLDEGRITLADPLHRWFPEFADSPLRNITVLNLLTHTSGLADVNLHPGQSMATALAKVANQRPHATGHFHYADINFILLGEMVHRVSGDTLDIFCRNQIYAPLDAHETQFLPPRELARSIAPTLGFDSGVVQDANARRLGGVAGHAGLFSSAYDLARYARLILGGGELDNKRVLSQQAVTQMTTPYACDNGAVMRGLGWDIESPFSAPKGSFFSRMSFGHTGYSGSSIWIDPKQDLFVIFLTNRLEYRNVHAFNQLRHNVSTVAVASVSGPQDTPLLASLEAARVTAELQQQAATPTTIKFASLGSYKGGHGAKKCRVASRGHHKKDRHLAKAGRHGSGKSLAMRKRHRSRRSA